MAVDRVEIRSTSAGFQIEGFPNAEKLLKLEGPRAQRLSDLALHKEDLEFALECLEQINNVSERPYIIRQALWRSAVVHYMKCFGGNNSRFSLDSRSVYTGDAGALAAYNYFNSLRNRHLVHDENSYAQCLPTAILNRREEEHKIAKVVCLSFIGDTLDHANYSNLHLLITCALQWVSDQFENLACVLTAELEREPYETLFARPAVSYTAPGADEVHKARSTRRSD